jgi:hypothetical protein
VFVVFTGGYGKDFGIRVAELRLRKFNLLNPTGYVMHQQFNPLNPTGYVMYKQFNPLNPTGYVMHQQFNLLNPTGYLMHQQFTLLNPTGYVTHQQFFLHLFVWGPSAYASGRTSALWLIVLSPVLDVPTFSTSSALPRPLNKESWSCKLVI